jgi:DNA-binding response OmpR family regulator
MPFGRAIMSGSPEFAYVWRRTVAVDDRLDMAGRRSNLAHCRKRMSEPLHILVVDDEARMRAMLRRYLANEGYRVSEVANGEEMHAALASDGVNLILLDLNLPGDDGLSLARELRRRSDVPIIMLTGKSDLIDRVVGLEAGADDYVTKPFELRELLARIRTVMRRAGRRSSLPAVGLAELDPTAGNRVWFEGWQFDLMRRELRRPSGELVPLTASEFGLLCVFVRHPNRVLSRDQLMDLLKGREWTAFDRAVDSQVVRLRKKIEPDPASPALIKTVRGGGYIFAAAVTAG